MRRKGRPWSEIDAKLGVADGTSYKMVARWRESQTVEDVSQMRTDIAERIEHVLNQIADDTIDDKRAAVILKGLGQLATLYALKSPPAAQKIEHSGTIEHKAVPLTPEESLEAAERMQRNVEAVAAKHADSIIAKRLSQGEGSSGENAKRKDVSDEQGQGIVEGELVEGVS